MAPNTNHIEEAQIALLSKMRLHSNTVLSESERELCDVLIQDIYQKIKARRYNNGNGAGNTSGQSGRTEFLNETEEKAYRAKMESIRGLSAPDLVKKFVEAWNLGDFELEYCCLSKNFVRGGRGSESISAYTAKRQKRFRERHAGTGCVRKTADECRLLRSMGGEATVECVETHLFPTGESLFRRHYSLAHEEGCWRIIDFKNITTEAGKTTVTR